MLVQEGAFFGRLYSVRVKARCSFKIPKYLPDHIFRHYSCEEPSIYETWKCHIQLSIQAISIEIVPSDSFLVLKAHIESSILNHEANRVKLHLITLPLLRNPLPSLQTFPLAFYSRKVVSNIWYFSGKWLKRLFVRQIDIISMTDSTKHDLCQ